MERDILKKSRGLFRQEPGVVFAWNRRGEGRVPDHEAVSVPAGLAQRLLRGARSTRIRAHADRPTPARPGACLVRREPSAVWQPAYSRGSHRAGGACESEARHPFHAGRRSRGARIKRFSAGARRSSEARSAGRRRISWTGCNIEAPGPNQSLEIALTRARDSSSAARGKLYLAVVLGLVLACSVVGWADEAP